MLVFKCNVEYVSVYVHSATATVSVLLEQGETGAETAETNEVLCNTETAP